MDIAASSSPLSPAPVQCWRPEEAFEAAVAGTGGTDDGGDHSSAPVPAVSERNLSDVSLVDRICKTGQSSKVDFARRATKECCTSQPATLHLGMEAASAAAAAAAAAGIAAANSNKCGGAMTESDVVAVASNVAERSSTLEDNSMPVRLPSPVAEDSGPYEVDANSQQWQAEIKIQAPAQAPSMQQHDWEQMIRAHPGLVVELRREARSVQQRSAQLGTRARRLEAAACGETVPSEQDWMFLLQSTCPGLMNELQRETRIARRQNAELKDRARRLEMQHRAFHERVVREDQGMANPRRPAGGGVRRSDGVLSQPSASRRARSSSPLRDLYLSQDPTQPPVMEGAYWYSPPARRLCLGPGESLQAMEAMQRRSPARSRRTFVDVPEEIDDTPAVVPPVSIAPRHSTVITKVPGIPRAAAARAKVRFSARAEAAARAEALRLATLEAEAEAAHADTIACVEAATFLTRPAPSIPASVEEEVKEAPETLEILQEQPKIEGELETMSELQDVPNEVKAVSSPGFAWLAVEEDCGEGHSGFEAETATGINADAPAEDKCKWATCFGVPTDREATLTSTASEDLDKASPLRRLWSPPVPPAKETRRKVGSGSRMAEERDMLPERLNLAESMKAAVTLENELPDHELKPSTIESEAMASESKIRSNITTKLARGKDRKTILSGPSPQRKRCSASHEGGSKRAGAHGTRDSCSTFKPWMPPPPTEEELPRPAF